MDTFASTAIIAVPPSATVFGGLMVSCAKADPAPSAKTTPSIAIHFNALQLPLAKIAPVRISQSPLLKTFVFGNGGIGSVRHASAAKAPPHHVLKIL